MDLTTEEFVAKFHALPGFTSGERRKHLFVLLNSNIDSTFDFSELKPQSLFEQSLKYEVLKFYKSNAQLLKMLKEENPAVIEKILKLDWFIKETFEVMEADCLVSEIFPNLSFNSKVKLLNKLCLLLENSSKCDEYFCCIKEAYGRYLALKLLPACSETLLIKTLEDDRVELTNKQLLLMIKRNPSKTEEIFENLHNYDRNINIANKYKQVLKYLMQNYLPVFIRLNEKYLGTFKLGTRATRKFITNNKEICLDHSEKLQGLLKDDQIGKCLKDDFSKFFSKTFPKSLEKLIDNFDYFTSLLKSFKDEDKLSLLLNTFENCYGEGLLEHHHFMVPKLFEWMSSDYKDQWLKSHSKPNEISQEIWISFMGTEKSIPLLKDKILLSSNVKQRERLVKALVVTCKINKDENAFEEVCEYMVKKHRNDQLIVRSTFLESTMDNFNLKKLQERHWKHLNVLVSDMIINDDCCWLNRQYFRNYIIICFDKNLPFMDYIKPWIQNGVSMHNIFTEKQFLEIVFDALPLCFSGKQLKTHYIDYISYVAWWNKYHPKERISMSNHKDLVDMVLEKVENSEYPTFVEEFAMDCIMFDFEKATELKLLEVLANKPEPLYISDIGWLLKYHPLDALPYIQPLMKQVLKIHSPNYRFFKQIVDPKMSEAICAVCKDSLNSGSDEIKTRSLEVLSVMLPAEEFLQLIEEFRTESTLEHLSSITKFQKSIPRNFLSIIPPHIVFEPILQYCQGDYLKLTQYTLHGVCNNVAEKRLGDLITSLNKRAVSVRKHSIFLALKLLNKEDTIIFLKQFMENEKNVSLRKILFKSVFNLFLRNPDDNLWEIVKDNINGFSADDTEALYKLKNAKRIPKQFFGNYILFAWKILDEHCFDQKFEEGKSRILEKITQDNVALLPNDFCLELIQNNLFQKSHPKLVNQLNVFTSQYLIYSGYNDIKEVFLVIKKYFNVSYSRVYNFVQEFCQFFIKKKSDNFDVLTTFAALWNEMFQPYESLDIYLYINFTLIFVDSLKHNSIEVVGRRIAEICNDLFDIQSLDISIFKNVLENYFKDCFLEEMGGNLDQMNSLFIDNIVKSGNSDASLSLALALIPSDTALTLKGKSIYNSIVDVAGSNSHPWVQIQLYGYLINKKI